MPMVVKRQPTSLCFIFVLEFQFLKEQNGTTANGGQIKSDPKVAQGSRACTVM